MRFKLDENLGKTIACLFREAGYDAKTVRDQSLGGAPDASIFEMCIREQRCLVSLDLDFADPIRFPPSQTAGIVILRTGKRSSMALLQWLTKTYWRL